MSSHTVVKVGDTSASSSFIKFFFLAGKPKGFQEATQAQENGIWLEMTIKCMQDRIVTLEMESEDSLLNENSQNPSGKFFDAHLHLDPMYKWHWMMMMWPPQRVCCRLLQPPHFSINRDYQGIEEVRASNSVSEDFTQTARGLHTNSVRTSHKQCEDFTQTA